MSFDIDIRKSFGSFELNSRVKSEGGIVGLLGASGCGKSMTLQCIAGVIKPDKGHIIVNDRVLFDSDSGIDLVPQKRRVGFLFQNYALFPNMTVEQNINCGLLGIKDDSLNKEIRKERVAEMINKMRLEGLEKQKPAQLSGGQQQRVALGRILIGKPDIIMMDEPMSALDNYLQEKLRMELVEYLRDYNKDTIIVSHDRNEAYEMCDSIAVMDKGEILVKDETKKVFAAPGCRVAATLTGCKNIADAEKISDREIYVPSWGVTLKTEETVKDGLCAIGIRAHHFYSDKEENSYPVRITEVVEQPFEWVAKFRYEGQDQESEPVWWRISKNEPFDPETDHLGVCGRDILPLYF